MIGIRAITIGVAAAFLAGCSVTAQYEDVSSSSQYQSLMGQRLAATSELLLHRVTQDQGREGQVDLCSVTPPPGFVGPEVIDRSVLSSQAVFKVVGVRRCVNCLSGERVELVVLSDDALACGTAPIIINHQWVGSSVRLLPSGSVTPNQSFKPTPSAQPTWALDLP